MPKGLRSSRPIVGAPAGSHCDNRECTVLDELEHLRPLELEPFSMAASRIEHVKLNYLLGDVHSDDR